MRVAGSGAKLLRGRRGLVLDTWPVANRIIHGSAQQGVHAVDGMLADVCRCGGATSETLRKTRRKKGSARTNNRRDRVGAVLDESAGHKTKDQRRREDKTGGHGKTCSYPAREDVQWAGEEAPSVYCVGFSIE